MEGVWLTLILHENRKHKGELLYEWILRMAKSHGIHGGSVVRGIAGFGRHGVVHEQHFFELADQLPVKVEFAVTREEANGLLDLLKKEEIAIFYAISQAEFGIL